MLKERGKGALDTAVGHELAGGRADSGEKDLAPANAWQFGASGCDLHALFPDSQ